MTEEMEYYKQIGLKCELWDNKAEDMNRDELLAFVGFLDELATERENIKIKEGSFYGQ